MSDRIVRRDVPTLIHDGRAWAPADAYDRLREEAGRLREEIERLRRPTHICMDCGAVGWAGGYHDHGNGNAGDTARIDQILKQLEEEPDA
jgi:hypothetical protein